MFCATLAVVTRWFSLPALSVISQLILIMANRRILDSMMACYCPMVDGLATSVTTLSLTTSVQKHLLLHTIVLALSHFASLSRTLCLSQPHTSAANFVILNVQVPSTMQHIARLSNFTYELYLPSGAGINCQGNTTSEWAQQYTCGQDDTEAGARRPQIAALAHSDTTYFHCAL